MHVEINISALRRTHLSEYLIRVLFGGMITAMTGLIAKRFGPDVAGLFLAFPAIFPATATLLEKHETQKKRRLGLDGIARARAIASVDAAGSAMGSMGLIAFAVFVWKFLPKHSAAITLPIASVIWLVISIATWRVRKLIRLHRRPRNHRSVSKNV